MKLFIRDAKWVEMLSEHKIFKLICIGCNNHDQTPFNIFIGAKRSLVLIAMLELNLERYMQRKATNTPSIIT
jgi:hypothetical protein